MNQTDHARLVERLEGVREEHARRLGGVAASLILRDDRPTELEPRPARVIRVSHAADQVAGRLLLYRVVAVAEERPVTLEVGEVTPGLNAIEGLATEIAHDLDARAPLLVRREVGLAPLAEAQPLGLELVVGSTRNGLSLSRT